MTTFFVKEILRRDPANIIVRLEKWYARSDDPDCYKWLAAVDVGDGAIELIPADETGDLCDSDVLEKVRSEVADFIATEDESPDVISSICRQSGLKRFASDKARRAKLMKRAELQAGFLASEKLRIERMASDFGCTVALAMHIDSLEKRLRALDSATG
jgi:hypothetical protein